MAVKIAARSLGYALTPQTVGRSLHLPIFTKSQRFPNFSPAVFSSTYGYMPLDLHSAQGSLNHRLIRALPVDLDERRVSQGCGRFWAMREPCERLGTPRTVCGDSSSRQWSWKVLGASLEIETDEGVWGSGLKKNG